MVSRGAPKKRGDEGLCALGVSSCSLSDDAPIMFDLVIQNARIAPFTPVRTRIWRRHRSKQTLWGQHPRLQSQLDDVVGPRPMRMPCNGPASRRIAANTTAFMISERGCNQTFATVSAFETAWCPCG